MSGQTTTPPLTGGTAPTYRLKLGEFEITALSDGYLEGSVDLFAIQAGEAEKLLANAYRPPGPGFRLNVNAFVLNTGRQLILIDAGAIPGFSPSLSKLPDRLAAAGFKPEDFDAILMTHLHPDHVGALISAPGAARFPNAELVCSDVEHKFWWDDGIMNQMPDAMKGFFQGARAATEPYAKALRLFGKDGEVVSGVSAIALPGHTPGHTGYLIASGTESLLIWGDIVHAPPFQFKHPEVTVAFDADKPQAIATRKAIFDRVAADKTLVAGMHLEFPTFAHVQKDGAGYRAVPQPWKID